MNVTPKQLKIFLEVARTRTFAEAADILHMSQPALSLSLKKMESEVGGPLFFRTTRNVELTPEGAQFLNRAQGLNRDWEEAFEDLSRLFTLNKGTLSLACMPSFAGSRLPQLLQAFHQKYPDIIIKVYDLVMEKAIEAVQQGKVELALTFEPSDLIDLQFERLLDDHFHAAVPMQSPLASLTQVSWKQLCENPFISLNRGSAVRSWIESTLGQLKLDLNIVAEAGHLASVGQMVSSQIGVSVVPGICIEQMNSMGVTCIPIEGESVSKTIGIVTRKRHPLSRAADAFVQLAIRTC